uniref:NADH-ubiquinone oxidoreductase chain 1 n=1 Tax=Mecistocephalus marmoratus TaxID=980230 RepID=A0A4Y1K7Q2_9MYRI|nr:NADH dehydrogenase subunit 1 [Mecistocephalus marmoratus]ARU77316.1 NADH dehydrogenase subunit 1 [Mecistocephalus marmoratus]
MLLSQFVSFFFLAVCVLIGVAFLTLFERKGLGYIQIRKGPNKVGYGGVLQPFADAIKLFVKEGGYPLLSNFLPYYLCPILSLFLSLVVWLLMPYDSGMSDMSFGLLFFLCIVSVSVYPILGSGWYSNSKYALLGCLRSVAQTISYEVSLAMVIIGLVMVLGEYNFISFSGLQEDIWFMFLFFPFALLWVLVMLAETNRAPFDFAEGEAELVSGFNIEYGSGSFALIFMAEYASILMMSLVFSIMFWGGGSPSIILKLSFMAFFFIWVRGVLPGLRYDGLMYLAWKDMLPFVMNYFLLVLGLGVVGIVW